MRKQLNIKSEQCDQLSSTLEQLRKDLNDSNALNQQLKSDIEVVTVEKAAIEEDVMKKAKLLEDRDAALSEAYDEQTNVSANVRCVASKCACLQTNKKMEELREHVSMLQASESGLSEAQEKLLAVQKKLEEVSLG